MATSVTVAPLKSTPDISKIQNMTSRMVTVTRQGIARGPGHLVVPMIKNASLDQITELHKSLPVTVGAGPGTYHFEVHDEGSSEKDEWTVRLGAEVPEANLMSVPGVPASGPQGAASIPVPEGCIPMGHGYFYNPELGTLTTPQRMVFNWKPGEQIPGGHASPAASAIPPLQPGQIPPWGSYPATDANDRVKVLEDKIREDARARETADLIAGVERRAAEDRQRMETLIEKLTAKPSGPSETELRLQRDLDEQRRRSDELQRETNLRTEMKASADRLEALVRETTANKSDPMLMMLTQVMTSAMAAGAETSKAVQASATAQASASERHAQIIADRLGGSIMTPLQIVEMIKTAKDTTSNDKINSSMVEMFQNLFGMAKGLVKEQAEMYSQSGGPAWLPVAQEGVQALGRVAQMYAATKAREMAQAQQPQRPQYQPPQQQQQPQRQQVQQPQPQRQQPQQVQQAPQAPQVAQAAPPAAVPGRTANDAERDRIADQVFGPVPAADQQREAVAAVVYPPAAVAPPPAAAVAPPPQTAAPAPRKRRVAAPAPAPVVPDAVVSPTGMVVTPAGPPAIPIVGAPTEVIRQLTDELSDEDFFGPAHNNVLELRKALEETTPEQVAQFVMMARQQLMSLGMVPPCIEVLNGKHLDILVERLFPELEDESHGAIVEALEAQLRPPPGAGHQGQVAQA
jgi:hypothetical protein